MADSSATTSSGAARATVSPDGMLSRLDRIEQRLDGLDDLRTTVETALAAQARRIEAVLARQGRAAAPVDDGHVSSELVASLQATAAAVRAGEDDRLDRVEAAIHAILGPVESVTTAIEALDARVTALVEGHRAIPTAAARFAKAEERLAAASDAMDAVADALARQLEARDRAVAEERQELARAFAEQVVEGVGRRDRRRLARRLDPADPPPSGSEPRQAPRPPVVARPASTPVPATSPPPRPDVVPEPREVAPEPPEAAPEAVEPAANPVEVAPAAEEPRVQPSRRTKPVRRAASDPRDPAAIRRVLAGVRGLGPARQSALIDRFGSLDAIRAATDDELLEVPGIGSAMLPGIRDAVR